MYWFYNNVCVCVFLFKLELCRPFLIKVINIHISTLRVLSERKLNLVSEKCPVIFKIFRRKKNDFVFLMQPKMNNCGSRNLKFSQKCINFQNNILALYMLSSSFFFIGT